jgi:hypothetical protein
MLTRKTWPRCGRRSGADLQAEGLAGAAWGVDEEAGEVAAEGFAEGGGFVEADDAVAGFDGCDDVAGPAGAVGELVLGEFGSGAFGADGVGEGVSQVGHTCTLSGKPGATPGRGTLLA